MANSSTAENANIINHDYLGGNNQKWILEEATTPGVYESASYYLSNIYTGTYLTISGGVDVNGQDAIASAYDGTLKQRFKFTYMDNGAYRINAVCSSANKVLNVSGSQVDIWSVITGSANQNFKLIRNNTANYGGTYYIMVNGQYVGVNPSTGNTQLYSSTGTNRLWSFEKVYKGGADIISCTYWFDEGDLFFAGNAANISFTEHSNNMGYIANACNNSYNHTQALSKLKSSDIFVHSQHGSAGSMQFRIDDNNKTHFRLEGVRYLV